MDLALKVDFCTRSLHGQSTARNGLCTMLSAKGRCVVRISVVPDVDWILYGKGSRYEQFVVRREEEGGGRSESLKHTSNAAKWSKRCPPLARSEMCEATLKPNTLCDLSPTAG
jgi:hypothetical protein